MTRVNYSKSPNPKPEPEPEPEPVKKVEPVVENPEPVAEVKPAVKKSAPTSEPERRGSITRGSVVMPVLGAVDHTKFASEKERIAAMANTDESAARAGALDFSFNFG